MPDAFYTLSFSELQVMLNGKKEQEEAHNRDEWERTRWMAMTLLQVHLKKGRRLKASDLIVFPWEKTTESKIITPDERKAIFDKMRKESSKKPIKIEPLRLTQSGKMI